MLKSKIFESQAIKIVYCLRPLLTVFQLDVYVGGQLYWWRKVEIPGENHPLATHILTYTIYVHCR